MENNLTNLNTNLSESNNIETLKEHLSSHWLEIRFTNEDNKTVRAECTSNNDLLYGGKKVYNLGEDENTGEYRVITVNGKYLTFNDDAKVQAYTKKLVNFQVNPVKEIKLTSSENKLKTLKDSLILSWIEVNFTKKDGTIRNMICTTNLELIPEESHPKKKEQMTEEKAIKENTLFNVYEKNVGWRSFQKDSVINYTVTINI